MERVPLPRETWDVVVYGGTPGGILAAVTAARAGARVVLLEPSAHIGGMMTNGLTYTDIGDHTTMGGYTGDFFSRMAYVGGTVASRFHFEGKVAERELWRLLRGAGVEVHLGQALHEEDGIVAQANVIQQLRMTSGLVFTGRAFIDGTYEGDLMAGAGVTYRVGRESTGEYGESLAGVGMPHEIMVVPEGMELGFPTSPEPGTPGSADLGIQNSNFRLCFSLDPGNQVPFPMPEGYEATHYEILLEWMQVQEAEGRGPARLGWFMWLGALPNQKFDVNEYGSMSLGLPGANWGYPEGTYAQREAITALHRAYDQGFLWFLRHDPRVPAAVQDELARYGLCADEFTDNANWPRRIYLREGRRMVGEYVLTEHDIVSTRTKDDIVGIGSYPLDSHYVSRWITEDRRLMFEGGFFTGESRQYAMPYRILLPRTGEVTNLLVPVAASASHVAFASLRMEPQYMLLGEAAGQAAAMAVASDRQRVDLHGLSVEALQQALVAHGSKLTNPSGPSEDLVVVELREGE